jgi:hypothetical protein
MSHSYGELVAPRARFFERFFERGKTRVEHDGGGVFGLLLL